MRILPLVRDGAVARAPFVSRLERASMDFGRLMWIIGAVTRPYTNLWLACESQPLFAMRYLGWNQSCAAPAVSMRAGSVFTSTLLAGRISRIGGTPSASSAGERILQPKNGSVFRSPFVLILRVRTPRSASGSLTRVRRGLAQLSMSVESTATSRPMSGSRFFNSSTTPAMGCSGKSARSESRRKNRLKALLEGSASPNPLASRSSGERSNRSMNPTTCRSESRYLSARARSMTRGEYPGRPFPRPRRRLFQKGLDGRQAFDGVQDEF